LTFIFIADLRGAESSSDGSYTTASPGHNIPGVSSDHPLRRADSPYTHPDDSFSSIIASTPDTQSEYIHIYDRPGYESPVPLDEVLADIRNERRYRLLLQHEFHPSRELFKAFYE
jgi:abelson tyrosine-protein kinase 1